MILWLWIVLRKGEDISPYGMLYRSNGIYPGSEFPFAVAPLSLRAYEKQSSARYTKESIQYFVIDLGDTQDHPEKGMLASNGRLLARASVGSSGIVSLFSLHAISPTLCKRLSFDA